VRADPATADSWGAAYMLDFFVDLAAKDASARPQVDQAVAFVLGGQCPNGAWSVSRQFDRAVASGELDGSSARTDAAGRTQSVNTGPSLEALVRASKAGFAVDADALARGKTALLAMRASPGAYTYTWPKTLVHDAPDESIARGPSCEHALHLLGATSGTDLRATLDLFMKYRKELRLPAKLNPAWNNPHAFSSYFCFFAYYHAARAMTDVVGTRAMLVALRKDVLDMVEADGTWLDCEDIGKPYGTAMALMVLRFAR
jgi:hypothetical protein